MRRSLVRRETGNEEFAATTFCRRRRNRAVERDPDDRAVQPVLGHTGGDVCVMMLNREMRTVGITMLGKSA
jgi:hypothetical protein